MSLTAIERGIYQYPKVVCFSVHVLLLSYIFLTVFFVWVLQFGEIIECRVLKDRNARSNKGVAFVQFDNKAQANNGKGLPLALIRFGILTSWVSLYFVLM